MKTKHIIIFAAAVIAVLALTVIFKTQNPILPQSGTYLRHEPIDGATPYLTLDMEALTFQLSTGQPDSYVETGTVRVSTATANAEITLVGEEARYRFSVLGRKTLTLAGKSSGTYTESLPIPNRSQFLLSEEKG